MDCARKLRHWENIRTTQREARDRTCSRLAVADTANHYPAFKSKQQSSCTVQRLSLSSFSSSVASALRRDFSCLFFEHFPLFAGRAHRTQAEQLKPDALLRLSIGGLTLTLLQEDPPPQPPDSAASMAGVSEVFFQELAFFKDSMFNERDFHHLRGSFAKACPHSHLRLQRNTKQANSLDKYVATQHIYPFIAATDGIIPILIWHVSLLIFFCLWKYHTFRSNQWKYETYEPLFNHTV